ncbi:hypothetical protein H012_gp279 [Acanthamoeba polyphaga moumouvirus]|uniref:Uncharacterized protein n=1 Tax=Acanthamoeba polyphaga moumouvirus TaxID=1269028 RepID=L7RGH5_9VIRU|nr:hypothetical protein H012_gp279 [Acanthamoeba polyphaga moumouvirus]AGC02175.1 hypothetical protein Moumou_00651 [Acanthamoeba polyphaga moumouvirus]
MSTRKSNASFSQSNGNPGRPRNRKSEPTYKFASVSSENERGPDLVEKFGHFPVVTSSLSLLLSFLLRQLSYMSKRDKDLGELVNWSRQSLPQTVKRRGDLQSLANQISGYPLNCASWHILRCYESQNDDGTKYYGSLWYSGKNKVSNNVLAENTMTLAQARVDYLLDQICFRLSSANKKIDTRANCAEDFYVKDVLDNSFDFFDGLLARLLVNNGDEFNQFLDKLREVERAREEYYRNRQHNVSEQPKRYNKRVTKQPQAEQPQAEQPQAEQSSTVEQKPVEKKTTKVTIKPEFNKPVKEGFSYASATGNVSQSSVESV